MAFCIQCGSDLLVDEARFCPLCGAPQPRPGQGAPSGAAPQAPEHPAPEQSPAPLSDLELPVYPDDAGDAHAAALPSPPPVAPAPAAAAPPPGGAPTSATPVPAGAPAAAGSPSVAYFWRITAGDRIAALGSLVVLISLFLPWFSGHVASPAAGVGRLGHNVFISIHVRTDAMGAGGWHWLLLLLSAGIFVYVGLRTLPGENVRLPLPHRQILGLATGVQLGLALLSLLLPPTIGSWSPSYGAVIGVLAAAVAVVGAWLRRRDPEVIAQPPAPGEARRLWPERAERTERPARPPRSPRPERRRGRDAVTVVVPEDAPVNWVSVPPAGAPPAAPGAAEGPPTGGRRSRRVAATQEYHVPGATGAGPGPGAASRSPASPPPAQAPPPGPRDPYGPDDTSVLAARRPTSRPAEAGEGGPSEVVCAICGTTNTVTAKVCRTCGVVLVPRSERS